MHKTTAQVVTARKAATVESDPLGSNGSNRKSTGESSTVTSEAYADRWEQLLEKLNLLRADVCDQSCEDFVKWAPKVARYSFQSGRVLLMQNIKAPNE